jgi:AcrR family transcriptional regulator
MPISDCEIRDPRIRRTRQLLQAALRGLMETRGFEDIAVQDITEAATVNRATFYDHYTDKYALLEAMVAGRFHALLAERRVSYDGSCPSAAEAIIRATCDFLSRDHSGKAACERHSPFQPLVDAAIVAAIRRVLIEGVSSHGLGDDGIQPEIVATAASWAIYGAARGWFQTPNRPPVEEIAPVILGWVVPMLQSRSKAGAPDPITEGVVRSTAVSA